MFIVVEGADAVGKNTLTSSLLEWIKSTGQEATKISFPRYETPVGKLIRDHLTSKILLVGPKPQDDSIRYDVEAANNLMFQCLMLADKVDAASFIKSELAAGKVVIADRYWQSAYVYGSVDGLDIAWLLKTHELLPEADLNILLDLPTEEAARRRPQYRDRYERDREKMAAVRLGYLNLWAKWPQWNTVDALWHPDDVLKTVKELVKKVSQVK